MLFIDRLDLLYSDKQSLLNLKEALPFLPFFQTLTKIKLMMETENLYEDGDHLVLYENKDPFGSNCLLIRNVFNSSDFQFLQRLPNFRFSAFDGLQGLVGEELNLNNLSVGLRYLVYYQNLSSEVQFEKLGPYLRRVEMLPSSYRTLLGKTIRDYDFTQHSLLDLGVLARKDLQSASLNRSGPRQHPTPSVSPVLSPFAVPLYQTNGCRMLVNHLGNLLVCYEDKDPKKVKSLLLPFSQNKKCQKKCSHFLFFSLVFI